MVRWSLLVFFVLLSVAFYFPVTKEVEGESSYLVIPDNSPSPPPHIAGINGISPESIVKKNSDVPCAPDTSTSRIEVVATKVEITTTMIDSISKSVREVITTITALVTMATWLMHLKKSTVTPDEANNQPA